MNLSLKDLSKLNKADIINAERFSGCFSGVSTDSRRIKKGELFFAIKGEKTDGHNYIREVVGKGAGAAVVNRNWYKALSEKDRSSFKNITLVAVKDTVKSLGGLASVYRDKFAIPVIAVGGSNGKTTVKDMIAFVLSAEFNVLKTQGNYNNHIGLPLTVFRLNKSHDMAVLELGTNRFGDIKYLTEIAKPQFGLVTNIGREHLELLRDIRGVVREEGELIKYIKKCYGTFFKNMDDRYVCKMGSSSRLKEFTYGSKGKTDVKGKIRRFDKFFPVIELKYKNKLIETKLNIIGLQSYSAALAAGAVGFFFDVKPDKIKKALSEFTVQSGGRNNLLNIGGVWVIDDSYNSNPDSAIAALDNLKRYETGGRKHIVLGDMLELGKSSVYEHRKIGRYIKKLGFENLYTFGNDSYYTHCGAGKLKNNFYFNDKVTLAETLKLFIRKNDIVLIKGSRAMKMEEIIEYLKN
ncbi:MAG: UDP-N-acetylmuramoyl-tripeptide--D-alanyl-D-alanine ligase [Ignavibacteria bacterium]|nr:UDP-N-acetylmuramoyl-tripeptide--D-alanyl-D-alanine ligase [Ignavibacteria bacterium]